MKKYIVAPVAEGDIQQTIKYIAKDNANAASKFIDDLYDCFQYLADNPRTGKVRSNLTKLPVRFWPFRPHYVIVYRTRDPLQIVRVLNTYRDFKKLLTDI